MIVTIEIEWGREDTEWLHQWPQYLKWHQNNVPLRTIKIYFISSFLSGSLMVCLSAYSWAVVSHIIDGMDWRAVTSSTFHFLSPTASGLVTSLLFSCSFALQTVPQVNEIHCRLSVWSKHTPCAKYSKFAWQFSYSQLNNHIHWLKTHSLQASKSLPLICLSQLIDCFDCFWPQGIKPVTAVFCRKKKNTNLIMMCLGIQYSNSKLTLMMKITDII